MIKLSFFVLFLFSTLANTILDCIFNLQYESLLVGLGYNKCPTCMPLPAGQIRTKSYIEKSESDPNLSPIANPGDFQD
jgi:hypothetical protein